MRGASPPPAVRKLANIGVATTGVAHPTVIGPDRAVRGAGFATGREGGAS